MLPNVIYQIYWSAYNHYDNSLYVGTYGTTMVFTYHKTIVDGKFVNQSVTLTEADFLQPYANGEW